MPPRQHRRRYTIAYKREAIQLAEIVSEEIVSARLGISRWTLRGWIANATAIMTHQGLARRPTVGGQGRHEMIPFSQDLVTHMKDVRREERVRFHSISVSCEYV
jgi:transposase-like protein